MQDARDARGVLGDSVVALVDALAPPFPELAALRSAAIEFDPFYFPTRHADGLVAGAPSKAFGPEQSERALGASERSLAAVDAHVA